MKDYHLHYTGSLPIEYVHSKIDFPIFGINNIELSDFNERIENYWNKCFIENKQKFFEIYSIFQKATKPKNIDEYTSSYKEGCFQIASKCLSEGIDEYDIIAGPCDTSDLTYKRIKGMVEGLEKAEKAFNMGRGRIRLTFIRDENGKIKNYSKSLLSDIFIMLQDSYLGERVTGFDISGEEKPFKNYFEENISILKEVHALNETHGTNFEIGLHAGENLSGTKNDTLYFELFENLLKIKVDRIAHGTFLWLDINKEKELMIKDFAKKRCTFDICPRANYLLTPLGIKGAIPWKFFNDINLKYTINRDNPSIFNSWVSL